MKRLEQIIELVKEIVTASHQERRGRPRKAKQGRPFKYDLGKMVLIFLLKSLKNWSINHTHKKLTDEIDGTWRQMLGVSREELPSRRWLNELWSHRRIQALRQQIHRRLLRRMLTQVDLETLAVDLTNLPVDPAQDALAAWGYGSDDKAFYGYKIHVLCSGDGLPLAVRLTRANGHELNEVVPLLRETGALLGRTMGVVNHVLGDAAYDANRIYDQTYQHLEANFRADANRRNANVSDDDIQQMSPDVAQRIAKHPRRRQALLERYSTAGKERHRRRTIIEELFGVLKELMPGFTEFGWHQVGLQRLHHHFRWLFFAFVAILARNRLHQESLLAIKMTVQ